MKAAPVDPRDAAWEIDVRRDRVHFWSPDGSHCTEYELSDVPDVATALSWVEQNAEGRVPEVFAVLASCGGDLGVARLLGGRPGA